MSEILAPLFNGAVVGRRWLSLLLKSACSVYARYVDVKPVRYANKQLDYVMSLRSKRGE